MKSVSLAFRLALKFALIVAFVINCFSFAAVVLLKGSVRHNQESELEQSLSLMEKGKETDIPYYVSYSAFPFEKDEAKNVPILTNDSFLPLLPISPKASRYVAKDYFFDGDMNLLYKSSIVENETGKFIYQVAMNMDTDSSNAFLILTLKIACILFLPIVLLSFFLVYLLTKSSLSPVKKITEKARHITSSNLDEKLPVSTYNDELDKLSVTFNSLFERLKSDFDREKQFTSDVSHELKTPLAVILGHAKLIRRWGKEDPAVLDESLDSLIKEVRHIESMIESLLRLSRLESGRQKIKENTVCCQDLFSRLIADTKTWSSDTEFSIKTNELIFVKADEELLYQLLTILTSNSVKYYPLSENYENEKKLCITLNAYTEGQNVIFEVEDNGKGIDEKDIPKIFDRFYRADPSHNRKITGSGLGLSIAKSIVRTWDGEIGIKNSNSSGAIFYFSCPKC